MFALLYVAVWTLRSLVIVAPGLDSRPNRYSKVGGRLQGAWLERAGFAIGVQVKVHVSPGRLIIETAAPERTESRGTGEHCASLRRRIAETRARRVCATLEAKPDRLTPADQRLAALRRRRP